MSYQSPKSSLETVPTLSLQSLNNAESELDAHEESAKLRFCKYCHAWTANQQFGSIQSHSSSCAVCGSDFNKRKLIRRLSFSSVPFLSTWFVGTVIVVGVYLSVTLVRHGS
ncbi:hypothetical protein LRP52_17080 [Photobacterium sp. ZSDE20]|nr:hypothetical protein [Photobacterium sp. ZSDE20]